MARGPQALLDEGLRLHRGGRLHEALARYDAFLAVEPAFAPAHNNRGAVLTALGRPEEAIASLKTALALRPAYAEACSNLGDALRDLRRPLEALALYDNALALRPGLAEALSNRGNALFDLGRLEEAVASYDRAIAARPRFADAHRNRGAALYRLNRTPEAVDSYAAAIAIAPGDTEARYQQGLACLQMGDFAAGWPAIEWRKRRGGGRPPPLDWIGEGDISRARVLVDDEQGFGDTIQFSRFLPSLAARCASLALRVRPPLAALMRASFPQVRVVSGDETPPPFDRRCAVMSLPLALGIEPDAFAGSGAYLVARQSPPRAGRPRVGLAWAGSPYHPDDRNRSIALGQLAPLLSPGVDWISVQKDLRPGDAERLGPVVHPGGALADFAETAALIASVDLVIAVDTAVAHLAGALGKPVWILLPFSPDWRWGLGCADSAWYPSARVLRQPSPGDWNAVIAAAAAALAARFA